MASKKLNSVLLIDDSEADNFLHQIVLEEFELAESIIVCKTGMEALNFLLSSGKPMPELILLDINMPLMNGWEFLKELEKEPDFQSRGVVIVMLSASMREADVEMSRSNQLVSGFVPKPLTKENLQHLIHHHLK